MSEFAFCSSSIVSVCCQFINVFAILKSKVVKYHIYHLILTNFQWNANLDRNDEILT